MKKIGFIDYFLSEWHANNYPEWIAKNCRQTGREFKVAYAYAELDKSPYDGVTTDEWCKKFNVEKCESIQEIAEKSDYLIILSPDNPEKHLQYAKQALKTGKSCYIDKTFAPDLATAKEIFSVAKNYNSKIFSSSALRFADEIAGYNGGASNIITTGGGTFEIYSIHQIEMIVKVMGTGAKRVKAVLEGINRAFIIDYGNGRRASLNQINAPQTPFNVGIEKDGQSNFYIIQSDFFKTLIDKILCLFEDKEMPVNERQTLEVIAIRDAALKALKITDQWVDIESY